MTPAHVAFGLEVKRRRVEQGLSIDALGARAGLTANFVCKVENAKMDLSLASAFKLAKGLGCVVSDLMPAINGGLSAPAREAGQRFTELPKGAVRAAMLHLIRILASGGRKP